MPDAGSSAEAGSSSDHLRFVTITDISERDNPQNRKIVRSHAMRFAHKSIKATVRKAQQPNARSSFGVFSKETDGLSRGKQHGLSDEILRPTIKSENNPSAGALTRDYKRDQEKIIRWKQWAPCPVTLLGAGRVDPFSSIPLKPKPYFDFLVDHCKSWTLILSHGMTILYDLIFLILPSQRGPRLL